MAAPIYSKYLGNGGGGGSGVTTVGTIDSQAKSANGAVISGASIYFQTADTTHPGMVVKGNLTAAGVDGIALTSGTGAVIGSGTSIAQHVADSTHNGYLSSTDWTTFNNKQAALSFPLANNLGGTGTDSSAATGIAHVASGTWSYSAIVNADVSASAAIVYSKLSLTGSILNADISNSAAIAFSKLAALTSAHFLVGSAGNVATDVAMSGDISLANTGATAIVATTNSSLTSLTAAAGVAIHGVITNSNAAAGFVGEFFGANPVGDVTPAASNSYVEIASIPLTAGDWDVEGMANLVPDALLTGTRMQLAVSTSNTGPDSSAFGGFINLPMTISTSLSTAFGTGTRRFILPSNTTVYLIGLLTYGTLGPTTVFSGAASYIRARRPR